MTLAEYLREWLAEEFRRRLAEAIEERFAGPFQGVEVDQ